jgi:hypothetical protein
MLEFSPFFELFSPSGDRDADLNRLIVVAKMLSKITLLTTEPQLVTAKSPTCHFFARSGGWTLRDKSTTRF